MLNICTIFKQSFQKILYVSVYETATSFLTECCSKKSLKNLVTCSVEGCCYLECTAERNG